MVALVLLACTALAAALRFPFLDHQSLWLDEVYTRQVAGEAGLAGLWRHLEATESTPPLYYVLVWLTSTTTVVMRAIPALALTASVPVGYLATRRLAGQRPALAAAAMLAVSPMLVAYSTDARSYGLFVLTSLLSLWAFGAALEGDGQRGWALWLAASVACLWTHYFGAFLVAGEAVLLFTLRADRRALTAAWTLGIVLCCTPLLALAAHQSSDERAGFIAETGLGSRIESTVREFAMGANVPRAWLEGAGLEDRFYARNVILALPLLGAVAAPALLRARGVPLAAYLIAATAAALWVATNWRYEQLDWRDALARSQALDPSAPVLAVTRDSEPVVQVYLGRAPAASGSLVASSVWVVVEPTRPAGQRALTPAAAPSLPGFTPVRRLVTQGFTLQLLRSAQPRPIVAAGVPEGVLFPGSGDAEDSADRRR